MVQIMSGAKRWKDVLAGRMPDSIAREIEQYEQQIELKKQGKLEDPVFNEMRLRRGVYGQRYDNGKRHDGVKTQQLAFPNAGITKGVGTVWDAPGMQRIKIPFGGVSADQLDALAAVAEEYADGVLHVTTRQDFQLHFVHLEDTPDLMRRLAAAGITTREACGNTVRNVTACPIAGVCSTESFDVSPHARATAAYLLGHPDTQDFGRKLKIAFSGCAETACGLTTIHDIGCIARLKDGKRGFEYYVGGGLGPVPYQAQLFDSFLPEEELIPVTQAVCRVFARLGEKKNRSRARLKFLVHKLGLEEFKRLVLEDRQKLPSDPRWTEFLTELSALDRPAVPGRQLSAEVVPPGFDAWKKTNVMPQRQTGYSVVTLALPLGDMTSEQARGLADLARRFTGDTLRTTVEQNIVMRWVSDGDLIDLYEGITATGLHAPGAGTIADVTACPGTDTCKLGISSSRGLAEELRSRFAEKLAILDPAIAGLRIKASGCSNSCGQHHIADLGFWGVSRKVKGFTVPHFQVVLGGQWQQNAASYGVAIGAAPSKNIPKVIDRLSGKYLEGRTAGESFQAWMARVGKAKVREMLEDLFAVPDRAVDPSFYSDWGDPREYSIGDLGVGECAGEIVSPVDFGLQASEREAFEALTRLDKADVAGAGAIAYRAMLTAARALVRAQKEDTPDDPSVVEQEFRTRFFDTKLFFDAFTGPKNAHYFFRAHEEERAGPLGSADLAKKRIVEAQLFIEAAHACWQKMSQESAL